MTAETALSPLAAVAAEFPEWQVTIRPAGLSIITAYWQSADGRHRRYIVAPSAAQLLAALRAIGEEPA